MSHLFFPYLVETKRKLEIEILKDNINAFSHIVWFGFHFDFYNTPPSLSPSLCVCRKTKIESFPCLGSSLNRVSLKYNLLYFCWKQGLTLSQMSDIYMSTITIHM